MLASANPDKSAEIRALLDPGRAGTPPARGGRGRGDGETLEENARLKAGRGRRDRRAAVADDTGLEVAALRGAPGVDPSRYAGEDASYEENVAKLLGGMAGQWATGGRGSGRSPWCAGPTGARCSPRARSRGASPTSRGGRRVRLRPRVPARGRRRAHLRRAGPRRRRLSHRAPSPSPAWPSCSRADRRRSPPAQVDRPCHRSASSPRTRCMPLVVGDRRVDVGGP